MAFFGWLLRVEWLRSQCLVFQNNYTAGFTFKADPLNICGNKRDGGPVFLEEVHPVIVIKKDRARFNWADKSNLRRKEL